MDYALYIASAVGAVALFMMMPRGRTTLVRIGALLGAATLGALWLVLDRALPIDAGETGGTGLGVAGWAYYYIFSALAIGAAARVITHTKPVYAALWFVMVVLASSGLFLVLQAEFMAFAMVIIYGGAILVTYVFVIMLASNTGDTPTDEQGPTYDRLAREPAAAVVVGFLLLAMLLGVAFEPMQPNSAARAASDIDIIDAVLTNRPPARPTTLNADGVEPTLTNGERVGLDLFQSHPLGLELAGVILLVSLVGAVVIARQRADFEDETNVTPA